jgi:ceramide glucosyltransferase
MSGFSPFPHPWVMVPPLLSMVYDEEAVILLKRWMNESVAEFEGPLESITFFRPLKRGVPDLAGKLGALVATSLPRDQIILGVDAGSPEEIFCEEFRRAHPERVIDVVRCVAGGAVNPKIAKLVQMEPVARHGAWLLSDSEMIFEPGFLEAFRREWQVRGSAALTAGYRFVNLHSWPQRCDAVHILLTLWPGLAMIRPFGKVNLTLGACTLFRAEALRAVGGWAAFGRDLGEDQRMGAALAKAGMTVHLSRHVATLDSDPMTWTDYWRHQRRAAVTYRAANPAGFAGMLVTYGPLWALISMLLFPEPTLVFYFVFVTAIRGWRIWKTARVLQFPVAGLAVSSTIASGMEVLCWVLSWFPARVWWSGRWWRVDFRGRFSHEVPAMEPPR